MKKTLITLMAAMFSLMVGSAFAAKHAMEEATMKACKDKKPGTEVTVDGKKVKCPEPKK